MIMGIDTFLDMGRSATNVIGNSLATAVVAKWEGELGPEHELVPTMPCRRTCVPGDARDGRPLTGVHHAPFLRRFRAACCWRRACWRPARPPRPAAARGLARRWPASRQTHVVRLGYRESSPPFSFLDQSNRPIGYSLELCEAIVEEIGVEVDDPNLKIDYVKVTSDDRIPAVSQNKIDLECGSTTANAERANGSRSRR